MKSSVEALEGNQVKLVVEVEADEFEKDIDVAFRKLAREVKLPGFRPGKAPRKVLEARIGADYARQEAFRDGLPNYYVEAVKEHEVDVIGPPEIDITAGEETGDITFDAVVEVRPTIEISGYDSFELEIPSPTVSDDDIDEQVDQMLGQFGTLEDVQRPAADGDRVTIDIAVTHEGEAVDGLTADGYLYQVGMGAVVPELDEQLDGASEGDELSFDAAHPDEEEEEPLHFEVKVGPVQATVLPEANDEWAKENSEFETIAELRDDLRDRGVRVKVNQAEVAQRNAAAEKLAELVDADSVPEALVSMEFENRVQDMAMRMQAQGIDMEQFMAMTGQAPEEMFGGLREQADQSARVDLALRALATAENLEITDEELDEEFAKVGEQIGKSVEEVRAQFADAGQIPAVRSDLQKSKALDWVVEQSSLVDEDGNTIDPADLVLPEEPEEPAPDAETGATAGDEA